MSVTNTPASPALNLGALRTWGVFWFLVATLGSFAFFYEGISELLRAWQLPEYSHGPLIPVLSLLLFLRGLKSMPVNPGEVTDRWPGLALMIFSMLLGLAGKMLQINDIVAYALILWVGSILLISFGWNAGRHHWPPVLHLIYMLPLPAALYYGLSTYLQVVSSELGVFFLQMLNVPVFLEGNIIDLGVYKLHVAEACSGLRYLFPILSFSYIFAVLYQGPMWHKAVLLISAAPITVFMNSVRIAIAGVIVDRYGLEYVEGFSHFFEGWVIFVLCVLILFALAWLMLRFRRDRVSLIDALDLETTGLGTQIMRLQYIRPSTALISAALISVFMATAWQMVPERAPVVAERDPFTLFPIRLGEWESGPQRLLDPQTEQVLAADDYYSVSLSRADGTPSVDLFMAWYKDQLTGGTHDPEVCLPGGGWEIADLKQIEVTPAVEAPFMLNRVIIQQGVNRMLVYYWFEQQSNRTASTLSAKTQLMMGKLTNGRNDSAIVRLITPIDVDEGIGPAEARLKDAMDAVLEPLPRFVPPV
jgi:exosortase D (VPLPA-CTERM-specific)